MTNEQAEIQQAAREYFDKYVADGTDHRYPFEVLAGFHISRSEEERKRIQELERLLQGVEDVLNEVGAPKMNPEDDQAYLSWRGRIRFLGAEVSRLRGALEQIRNAPIGKTSIAQMRDMAKAALSSPPASAEKHASYCPMNDPVGKAYSKLGNFSTCTCGATQPAAQEVEPSAPPPEGTCEHGEIFYNCDKCSLGPTESPVNVRAASGQAGAGPRFSEWLLKAHTREYFRLAETLGRENMEHLDNRVQEFFPVSAPTSQPSAWHMKPCPPEFAALMTPPPDWIIAGPNCMSLMFSSEELEKLSKGHLQIIPLERLSELRALSAPKAPAGEWQTEDKQLKSFLMEKAPAPAPLDLETFAKEVFRMCVDREADEQDVDDYELLMALQAKARHLGSGEAV